MQILYVFFVSMFSLYAITSVHMSSTMKASNSSLLSARNLEIKTQQSLSRKARKAYDYGLNTTGCPVGTNEESGVGTSTVPLCWGSEVSNGCFQDIDFQGRNICLALNQVSMTHINKNFQMFAKYSLLFATADAAKREPSQMGDYSLGLLNTGPEPVYSQSPQASGSRVVLPGANAGLQVRTNHIDCRLGNTECFTIIFCLNGSRICSGRDRIVNTYAVRHF